MASKTIPTSLVIRGYCFSVLISHESMYFKTNQNVGILLLFVVSRVVVKMAESFAANNESRFHSPKTGEEESRLLQGSIPKSTAYKTKWEIKERRSEGFSFLNASSFTNFDAKIFVNEKKNELAV